LFDIYFVGLKGYTPTVFDSSPSNVIPNEDCWMLVTWMLGRFLWTCPILSQRSYHYTVIWVSYAYIHSSIHSTHTISFIYSYIIFRCLTPIHENVIHNVFDSSSSGRSHQLILVPVAVDFYPMVVTLVKVTDGFSSCMWSLLL
jgi:hypothetical protein